MKAKVVKFPDGRMAVSTKNMVVKVNKQEPVLEEEVSVASEKDFKKLMEKPHKYKFSKKAKKIKRGDRETDSVKEAYRARQAS